MPESRLPLLRDDTARADAFPPRGGAPRLDWVLSATPPPGLARWIEAAEGGFFHSPLGLEVGAPDGEPLYATLRTGSEGVGIAVGVMTTCRFASAPRHAYFPTLPAIRPARWRGRALRALIAALYHRGIAEVCFDSFDAGWVPQRLPSDGKDRIEHVVSLAGGADRIIDRLGSGHRRNCRRGIRGGWKLQRLYGESARAALDVVLESAAQRATVLGRGFRPAIFAGLNDDASATDPSAATLHVLSAYDGNTLLAAALVGVTRSQGYYIMGGSTPAGYQAYAGVWLHYSIMNWLAEQGCTDYNLGGTPAAAADPDDPGHGLYRFKTQFGGELRPCRSAHLVLRPAHMSLHRVIGFARGVLQR